MFAHHISLFDDHDWLSGHAMSVIIILYARETSDTAAIKASSCLLQNEKPRFGVVFNKTMCFTRVRIWDECYFAFDVRSWNNNLWLKLKSVCYLN